MYTLVRTYSIHICVTFPNIYLSIYIYITYKPTNFQLHVTQVLSTADGHTRLYDTGQGRKSTWGFTLLSWALLTDDGRDLPQKNMDLPPFFKNFVAKTSIQKYVTVWGLVFQLPYSIFLEAFLVSIGCSMRRTWEPFLVKPARCHLSYDVSSLIGQTGASWACCQPHGCDLKKPRVCLRCKEIEKYCPLSDYI